MRALNKNLVFNLIRESKIMTRPEICTATGLKPPSVKHIIEALMKENLIECLGKGESGANGGPRPELYSINNSICYFIGFDANIRRIAGVIMDLGGNIISSQFTYVSGSDTDILMMIMKDMTRDMLQAAKISIDQIAEISLGFAASVNKNKTRVAASPFEILYSFDVKRFREYLDCGNQTKITLENDANAVAMGSYCLAENLKNKENIICVIIRAGVGLGVIINGQVYRGHEGLTGNITKSENAYGETKIIERINELVDSGSAEVDTLKRKLIDRPDLHHTISQNEQVKQITHDCFQKIGEFASELVLVLNPDAVVFASELIDIEPGLFKSAIEGCEKGIREFYDGLFNDRSDITYHHTRMDIYSIAFYSAHYVMRAYSPLDEKNQTK